MKVVGVVCSPRKEGNTEILVKEALEAAKAAGAQTEMLLVADMTIAPCDGCLACVATGECIIKDDMQIVYKKFKEADGILFGTPVYFLNVTAQAKAVIDRTLCLYLNKILKDKVAAPIVAVRRVGGGEVVSILWSFFTLHEMFISKRCLGYGMNKGDVRNGVGGDADLSALQEASLVGELLVENIQRLAKVQR